MNPTKLANERIQLLFEYTNVNGRVPHAKEKYKNQPLGSWYQDQKKKINNIKSEMYIKLNKNECIKQNLDLYLEKKHNK